MNAMVGDALPLTHRDSSMHEAVVVMTEKRLGVIAVLLVVEQQEGGQRPVGVLHIHDCPAAR
jgi:hypothetical protein